MSETFKPSSESTTWIEATGQPTTEADKKAEKELKRIQEMAAAVATAKEDEPRGRDEDETIDQYTDYITLYFQGELIIRHEKREDETRSECVERLLQGFSRKLESAQKPEHDVPKSA